LVPLSLEAERANAGFNKRSGLVIWIFLESAGQRLLLTSVSQGLNGARRIRVGYGIAGSSKSAEGLNGDCQLVRGKVEVIPENGETGLKWNLSLDLSPH
jgi:hypothetical protein